MSFAADAAFVFNTEEGLTALGIELPVTDAGNGAFQTALDDAAVYTMDGVGMSVTHKADGSENGKTRIWKKASGALDLRTYKDGGSLTFTAPEGGTISKVVLDGGKINFTVDGAALTDNTWAGEAASVTLVATATCNVNTITVTYEAADEEKPEVTVPTNAELWEAFKPYYNTYYGLARADQPIDKVSTFANAKMQEIMTDAASEYKWLGDYVLSVATAAGVTLSTDMASANESGWRWAVHAFFNAAAGQYGAAGIDFTEAGKPENWGPYYLAAQQPAADPCTEAIAVNWDEKINLEANTDKWYAMNLTTAIEAGKDVVFTLTNTSADSVVVTVEAHEYCPTDEWSMMNSSTQTIKGNETISKVLDYAKYLEGQVEVIYVHVVTVGGSLDLGIEPVQPTNETVYFVNAQNWGAVYAYVWDAEGNNGGAWPGVAATIETDPFGGYVQIGGYDVYSYTAEAGAFVNVIFNDGSGTQTSNLVWEAGKYYVIDGWYTKEEAEAKLAEPIADIWTVAGAPATVFGTEWDPTNAENNMALQEDGTYKWEKTDLTLAASNIQFKVAKNNSWGEAYPADNYNLAIAEAGIYTITITFNPATQEVVGTATKTGSAVVIPTIAIAGDMNGWNTTANEFVVADDELTATLTLNLEAQDYGFKMIVAGGWTSDGATITRENNTTVFTGANGENSTLTADAAGEYTLTWTYATNTLAVTYPEIVEDSVMVLELPVEISNLTTSEMVVEGKTILQLTGSNDMEGVEVMLFIPDYTGEDKEYALDVNSYYLTLGGTELTLVEGALTKSTDEEKGDVFAGKVVATAEEEGEVVKVILDLTMYATPPVEIEIEDVTITVDEESAIAIFAADWEGTPLSVEVSGFEEAEFTEYPECWLTLGDDVNWVDAAAGPVAVIIEDGVAMLEGEFTSFATGKAYNVMLSGKLPVKEEPVVEPVYEENKLNPFAFGLESVLSEDASLLTVTYRLNNSNATSVDVVVYNGEEVVATVPGTTTIGVNVVEVATADLPAGVQLTWGIVVKGTSVEAPTQEEKMYSLYCPHGLAIDKDPESENFGRILVADAMNVVKDKAGYLGSGIGAGLHVFNPSFTTDSTVYTGGNDFTRILASNGYQPWRVKISEDGRIFVSSLDLNGVAVWEVSKDLQTWTPVIAGTNDATDYNIYDADSNFVAGPNCSMDVIGKGEDLKLLLYSTNNKGIAFNQSGYRLDEYALGTATTWTGTPTNIINGGAYGLVHTNVEFIYDGEGGYWFGASRAGNAGQPNLVHINAAGEQDYYTEDAGLYGGDGVLVHNGMLFKGKARTSSTVGNFGVWTIGKDADGKVTLTEKWTVAANGIGRNLNEFAVDYAENLYVVGNSGEKIIAYALPYSGEVTTPAASKYAFKLAAPVAIVGVVKRAVTVGESTVVLTHEADGTAHLYKVVDGVAVAELSQEGVIAVDPENAGDYLAISDIAVTEDGKLVATNYMQTQSGDDYVDAGLKRGETRIYLWNDLHDAPSILFTSKMSSNWFRSKQGLTMAVKGTSDNMEIFTTGIHATSAWARVSSYRVIDGVYTEPDVNHNDHYFFYDVADAVALETTVGTQYELTASPLGAMNWILDANLIDPIEIVESETNNVEISSCVALSQDLGKKYQGTSIVTVEEKVLMVAPYATETGLLAGVKVLDITAGLDAATEVTVAYLDSDVEATAAATAVKVVEGGLVVTLVADATIYTLNVEVKFEPAYMEIEEEVTDLVIDLDYMTLSGTGNNFGTEIYLTLGQDNADGTFTLDPENSFVTINGWDANFIEGYAYDIDINANTAKALTKVELNGEYFAITFNMSSTPVEALDIVITDAVVTVDTIPMFGDMVEYALNMTANWTNPADGVTYPVLVEIPVYYPESTEPSEIMSTVTVGGMGDTDPWLGFGEGYLTVTTANDVVTATGLVENTWAGFAANITISGKLPQGPGSGLDNVQVEVKTVKTIKNGQLIIVRDGKEFNAQGAMVK